MKTVLSRAALMRLLLAVGALCAFSARAQELTLVDLSGAELAISREAWHSLPRTELKAIDRGGEDAVFEGVSATELLGMLRAPLGAQLRGKNLSLYVVAEAGDGYRVVFSLAEFDPQFGARQILIADKRNGTALDAKEGPLRIVVAGDTRQSRWIRGVIRLELKQAD
jgi:hypothetical protein